MLFCPWNFMIVSLWNCLSQYRKLLCNSSYCSVFHYFGMSFLRERFSLNFGSYILTKWTVKNIWLSQSSDFHTESLYMLRKRIFYAMWHQLHDVCNKRSLLKCKICIIVSLWSHKIDLKLELNKLLNYTLFSKLGNSFGETQKGINSNKKISIITTAYLWNMNLVYESMVYLTL